MRRVSRKEIRRKRNKHEPPLQAGEGLRLKLVSVEGESPFLWKDEGKW